MLPSRVPARVAQPARARIHRILELQPAAAVPGSSAIVAPEAACSIETEAEPDQHIGGSKVVTCRHCNQPSLARRFWLAVYRFVYERAVEPIETLPDGVPAVRSADAPCRFYAPYGKPAPRAPYHFKCWGDGHYMCEECAHFDPSSDPDRVEIDWHHYDTRTRRLKPYVPTL